MNVTYFGHSALQIEAGGLTILVDPFISGNELATGVVTADELAPDYILLTHAHGDHWGDTSSIALRTGAQIIANYEITTYVQSKHGYDNTFAMNTGGSWKFAFGRATMTYARHSSSFPDGTYGGNPNGFMLEVDGKTIYLSGDTSPFTEMAWLAETFKIDAAFLPVGDCYTMGPEESLRAIKLLNPALTIPVHYNTFPYIEIDVDQWAADVRNAGFSPRVMAPGETITI